MQVCKDDEHNMHSIVILILQKTTKKETMNQAR